MCRKTYRFYRNFSLIFNPSEKFFCENRKMMSHKYQQDMILDRDMGNDETFDPVSKKVYTKTKQNLDSEIKKVNFDLSFFQKWQQRAAKFFKN